MFSRIGEKVQVCVGRYVALRAPRHVWPMNESARDSALELSLVNDLREIGAAAEKIDAFCEARSVSPQIAYAVNLSIDEILTNTISYGYDDEEEHRIDLTLRQEGDTLVVVIVDDGRAVRLFAGARTQRRRDSGRARSRRARPLSRAADDGRRGLPAPGCAQRHHVEEEHRRAGRGIVESIRLAARVLRLTEERNDGSHCAGLARAVRSRAVAAASSASVSVSTTP